MLVPGSSLQGCPEAQLERGPLLGMEQTTVG
jgi:hypothetical protein